MIQPMPRVPPFDRPATYDDLAALPDMMVAEIIDGELHASPRPAPRHANAEVALGTSLHATFQHGRGGPGGWWILGEVELHLTNDVVVPDWSGWRRDRMPVLPETAFISLPPDWMCEVLSPSTAKLDRTRKLGVYARERVRHAWLLDPIQKMLEVFRLEAGRWLLIGTHADNDVVRAEPFAEVALNLRDLWAD